MLRFVSGYLSYIHMVSSAPLACFVFGILSFSVSRFVYSYRAYHHRRRCDCSGGRHLLVLPAACLPPSLRARCDMVQYSSVVGKPSVAPRARRQSRRETAVPRAKEQQV